MILLSILALLTIGVLSIVLYVAFQLAQEAKDEQEKEYYETHGHLPKKEKGLIKWLGLKKA